jgi:hypothetical protein
MIIKLTSGATVQTLCDGYAYRGQTGYNVGPINLSGLDINWLARQASTPLRAAAAVPFAGTNSTVRISFGITREFSTEADAWEWAHYTLPAGILLIGTLGFFVTTKKHCDIANASLQSLRIVPVGVTVDVTFSFEGGAMTFTTDA